VVTFKKNTTYAIGPISSSRMREIMEDLWKSGGIGRAALGEELLEERFLPVLRPQDDKWKASPLYNSFKLGVGTPYLVQHPDGGLMYMLFTGWRTTDGSAREVFVAEIDEHFDIKVASIRKIIPLGTPSFVTGEQPAGTTGGHNACRVVYDPFADQWIVSTTSTDTVANTMRILFFRFNRDFTKMISWTDSGVSGVLDSGAPMIRTYSPAMAGRRLFVFWSQGHAIWIGRIEDLTTSLTIDSNSICWVVWRGTWDESPDVLDACLVGHNLLIVYEDLQPTYWFLRPAWIPMFNIEYLSPLTIETSPYPSQILGVAADGPLIDPWVSGGLGSHGHPHVTQLPDLKAWNLFLTIFRECPPSFRHEIWAYRLDPERMRPEYYPVLGCSFYGNPLYVAPSAPYKDITADRKFNSIPTFGKKVMLHLRTDQSGTLYSIPEAFPYQDELEAVLNPASAGVSATGINIFDAGQTGPYIRPRFAPSVTPASIQGWVS